MIQSSHIRFYDHIFLSLTVIFVTFWCKVNRTETTLIYCLRDKIDNKSFLYIQLGRKTSYRNNIITEFGRESSY